MMRRWIALGLALGLLLGALPGAQAETGKMTVLVYLCGTGLESDGGRATADIREMLASGAGASGDVTVLIATGGAAEWQRYGIAADRIQYHRLGGDGPEHMRDAGGGSMGDADTLSAFLRWGLDAAPASRCALILWDHGGGPVYGVCSDDNHEGDTLTLSELRRALSEGLGSRRLDILAFDACLMNAVDICQVAADYADYIVSSQEMVTGDGLDYDGWLGPLVKAPDMAPADIAVLMAKTYIESNASGRLRETGTMSVVEAAGMPGVLRAVDAFGEALTPLIAQNRSGITRLRSRLTSFGEFVGDDASDLVDVSAMCDAFAALLPEESAALKRAAADAVVYNGVTADIAGQAHGLSLFMPYSTARDEAEAIESAYGQSAAPYARMVRAMAASLAGGEYAMDGAGQHPDSFYNYTDEAGSSGTFCDIWNGLFGDTCSIDDISEATGGGIWAGLPDSGSVWSGTAGGIWAGLSLPAQTPTPAPEGSIWAGMPEAAATPAPGALAGIWAGLLDTGADYYQPGEANANVQPGISEAVTPDSLVTAAEYYFSASPLTAQSIYTLQLTKQDLDHLTDAAGTLCLRDGGDRILLGDIGETTVDWSTGMVYAMYDGMWPMLEGQMVRAQRLYQAEDGGMRFVIPATVNDIPMYLLATRGDDGAAQVLGATQGYDENGMAIRGCIPLKAGMTVAPRFTVFRADGSEAETAGNPIAVPEGGLRLEWTKLPEGEYEYGFSLIDLSGRAQLTQTVVIEIA